MTEVENEITIKDYQTARNLSGKKEQNLKMMESKLDIKLIARGNSIKIVGENDKVEIATRIINELIKLTSKNHLDQRKIEYAVKLLKRDPSINLSDIFDEVLQVNFKGREIKAKTVGQKIYVEAIKNFDLVFSIGPAGTGKTYLAMVMAVKNLLNKKINRIILTRPAIEAGENLGFLPGDMQEKVDPYLRPLYDALYDILGPEKVNEYLDKDIIEVAPLAYMRGRTLDDSFVILDEAQNTTPQQMKMFLTRIGFDSKAVITGDITQVDLPQNKNSGLNQVRNILDDIEGIEFVYLSNQDVVRHDLVKKIIQAYKNYESGN
ncbi:MAG: PhoH family protein [Halanaerobiales bacterium]